MARILGYPSQKRRISEFLKSNVVHPLAMNIPGGVSQLVGVCLLAAISVEQPCNLLNRPF